MYCYLINDNDNFYDLSDDDNFRRVSCYFSYFSRNKYLRDYVYFSSNWLRSRNDYNCDINALLDLRIESRSLSHYNDVLFNWLRNICIYYSSYLWTESPFLHLSQYLAGDGCEKWFILYSNCPISYNKRWFSLSRIVTWRFID